MNERTETVGSVPAERALIPANTRSALARRGARLPSLVRWVGLPVVARTAGALAAGLVVEYGLRALANHAFSQTALAPPHSHAQAPTAARASRTIVTEVVVIERYWRRS